jgi:predicted nucleotidyltransferase
MRLSEFEVESIKRAVRARLPNVKLYLFGSRTDDSRKGGDIDLLILSETAVERKIVRKIQNDLDELIGEQKIDIVSGYKITDPFVRYILPTAIQLL